MKRILFIIASGAFSSLAFSQSNNSLKLVKGQQYQVDTKIATINSIEMQGQSIDNTTDMASIYKIEVTEAQENNFTLTNTLTNIQMNVSMMGQEIKFDSDKKEDMDGQMGSAFKEFINQPKQVKLDHTGKVLTSDTTSISGLAKQLNFDVSGYGSQLAFQPIPSKLKAGDTWTDKINNEGDSKTITYVVKEINENIATITFTGTLSSETAMEQQGMELKQKTSGTYSGEEKVDIHTGVIQSNTSITDAKGTLTAMGQELPIITKITSATIVKAL